ncbi:MAG: hypothetical protein RI973_181 [Bacteroidota bacterium]
MNRLQVYLLCLFSGISFPLFSQQLPLFTQYRENQTLINPAAISRSYLTNEQNLSFGASYRRQWNGIEGAPQTAVLRGDFLYTDANPVTLITGGYLINDQTGPTGFSGVYGRVGGLITGDPYYGGIAAGLSLGAVQYRVNASQIRLRDQNDLVANDQSKIYPDVGLGVFAYKRMEGGFLKGDYLYGGISIPQVIGLDLNFKDASGEFSTQRIQHYYAMIGLYKFFRDDAFLEPSIWLKYLPNVPLNVDFNLRYQMAGNFWIGAGGSSSRAAHLETGVRIGENLGMDNDLQIGYGFDYHFSPYGPYTGGSHEINVTWSLER